MFDIGDQVYHNEFDKGTIIGYYEDNDWVMVDFGGDMGIYDVFDDDLNLI